MNGLVILVILLLILPAQIYFNYIIVASRREEVSDDGAKTSDSLSDILKRVEDSIVYYSTFEHFKEFFVVPHQRRPRNSLRKKFLQMLNQLDNPDHTKSNRPEKGTKATKDQMRDQDTKAARRSGNHGNMDTSTEVSDAKEVEQYNKESLYFARSLIKRTNRPRNLKYRVGEVVRHKQDGYHGVIIGWDLVCLAPDWWLRKHGYFTDKGKQGLLAHPHYLVLVEPEEDGEELLYYIPQQHLQLEDSALVKSSHVDEYFKYYSGQTGSYVAKDWLQELYPED